MALGGALAATLAAPRAHAQEPLPPPPPPPASARAPNGEYVAPLQQQTQPSYVPQSVALSGPATRPYNPDAPIPPGYHPEQRVRRGLIIGGAIPLGILYTFSILGAAAMEDSGESGEFLYVPVLGPFLQMSKTENSVGNTVLALDGIGQAAGAAMLLVGLTVPKTVLVRNDLGEIRLAPMNLGQRGSGLGLVGTF
ncbi:MAG TPA: hypothetical protein VFS43_00520 [Polyangiaceae bacterium]|nr:hypothetical protein [Polyangiaceae bacterium]